VPIKLVYPSRVSEFTPGFSGEPIIFVHTNSFFLDRKIFATHLKVPGIVINSLFLASIRQKQKKQKQNQLFVNGLSFSYFPNSSTWAGLTVYTRVYSIGSINSM
jgi:hypothetical protein